MIKNILIVGAGNFGFAFSKMLSEHADSTIKITIFDKNCDTIKKIKDKKYLKRVMIAEKIELGYDLIVFAIPSEYIKSFLVQNKDKILSDCVFLNLSKGFDSKSSKLISEIVDEMNFKNDFVHIGGGSIANDMISNKPIGLTIASNNIKLAYEIRNLFEQSNIMCQVSTDVLGVQLCGICKNIASIGAGIVDEYYKCDSSKALYVSLINQEILKFVQIWQIRQNTFDFASFAWSTDLLGSCYGQSRNRLFGINIAKKIKNSCLNTKINNNLIISKILKEQPTIEGYYALKYAFALIKNNKLNLPLIEKMYRILYLNSKELDILS